MSKKSFFVIYIFILFVITVSVGCVSGKQLGDEYVYQVSTIDSLKVGNFEGQTTLAEVLEYGYQGLGTVNDIDGEMIIYNGTAYRAGYDGALKITGKNEKTPFAVVSEFDPEYTVQIENQTCREIGSEIINTVGDNSLIFSLRLTGDFGQLRYRSVKKQAKPYPPLKKVIEEQNVMEAADIKGTAVGFYFPEEFSSVNAGGFHFHFINDSLTRGGHILDCELNSGIVKIDVKDKLIISVK